MGHDKPNDVNHFLAAENKTVISLIRVSVVLSVGK